MTIRANKRIYAERLLNELAPFEDLGDFSWCPHMVVARDLVYTMSSNGSYLKV